MDHELTSQNETITSSNASAVFSTFLHDTLILSVGDSIHPTVGQLALSNINVGVNSAIDLQNTGGLLTQTDLTTDGGTSHLISVQPDQATGQTLLVNQKHDPTPQEDLHMVATATGSYIGDGALGIVEDKKRKGGWPKGKKRKKELPQSAPRAPATGYVLYAIKRRQQLKHMQPNLAFRDITRILGSEWSAMGNEEKQKYLEEAEADKKRYMEELKIYQESPAYQNFLKKRKNKAVQDHKDTDDPLEYIDNKGYTVYEEDGLYCRLCNLYFSSAHNKREHMFGKEHLNNVTTAFEKEQMNHLESTSSENEFLNSDLSQDALHLSGSDQSSVQGSSVTAEVDVSQKPSCSNCNEAVDIGSFITDFMSKNHVRELEIKELRNSVETSMDKHRYLQTKLTSLKERLATMQQENTSFSSISASLAAQIDGLKMVPTLFGVIMSPPKLYPGADV